PGAGAPGGAGRPALGWGARASPPPPPPRLPPPPACQNPPRKYSGGKVTTLGLVNIGVVATGILAAPRLEAEAILVENGRITAAGTASRTGAGRADVVGACFGATLAPGVFDSHCHVVLGD